MSIGETRIQLELSRDFDRFLLKFKEDLLGDGGFKLFWGEDDYTFWGKLQDNTNAYLGIRYSFE